MFGQRAAIGIPGLGRAHPGRIHRVIFGMDLGNRRLDIFKSQLELIRVEPFGFTPEHRLPEGCDQQFQTRVAGMNGDYNRLQRGNIIRKAGHVQHGQRIANPRGIYPCNQRGDSSCRSYSTAIGARTSTARTRRQSNPENRASNCAWHRFITPSLIAGQVNVCSSSRL